MSDKILTNEIKQDELLPPTPVKSAELFIHPITSGIPKVSGGGELSFEQKLTDDNDNTVAKMKGGQSFYSDFSKQVAFRIYHDTNNGALLILSNGGRTIIGGTNFVDSGDLNNVTRIRALSESVMVTGALTSNAALTVFPDSMELSTTDASTIPLFRFSATTVDADTSLMLRRNVGGTYTLQRVSMGAVDSGGTGFKLLRVPN